MSQSALFPTKYVNLTQKWGGGTHRYGYPIDVAGKDTGIDNFYAPFDGVVKKIWENGHTVWLESTSKVKYADGTTDYATLSFTHDNKITDLKVGQVIKQGQVFYQEGTAGIATGNHVHLECSKGKFTGTGWYQAPNGQWVINNPYRPDKMLWLKSSNVVMNTLGLTFKEEEVKITDSDNEYARWKKLGRQIRGRTLTRSEFRKAAVGRTWLSAMEILSDNEESDQNQADADLGRKTRTSKTTGSAVTKTAVIDYISKNLK